MKRLVFIGTFCAPSVKEKSGASSDLLKSGFLRSSRLLGEAGRVTGFIYMVENICLYIVEGDSFEVAELMYKVKNDVSYKDFLLIFGGDVDKKLFGSVLRLVSKENASYNTFLKGFEKSGLRDVFLLASDDRAKKLVESLTPSVRSSRASSKSGLGGESVSANKEEGLSYYDGVYLKLKRWPRPTDISIRTDVVNVCGVLFGKGGADLNKIYTFNAHIPKDRVIKILDELNSVGLIEKIVKNEKESMLAASEPSLKNSGVSRFSSKLLRFLTVASK